MAISNSYLVGGFKDLFIFSIVYGLSSFALTFIFFRGLLHHQPATLNYQRVHFSCSSFIVQPIGFHLKRRNGSLSEVTTDFGYEFCFEAPNGSVKWYKARRSFDRR